LEGRQGRRKEEGGKKKTMLLRGEGASSIPIDRSYNP